MADSKLSALTEVTTLADTDEFYVNDGGTSKRITKENLDDNVDIALSQVNDVTATAAEVNKLDGFTGDYLDLNYAETLRATGVTGTEFDYLDGVTSNIQTQLDERYDPSNILDSVSETAGTPTGGIIESGSNANGYYTKLADGTMICRNTQTAGGEMTISYNNHYVTPETTWTYPEAFSSAPQVTISSSDSSAPSAWGVITDSPTTTAATWRLTNGNTAPVSPDASLIAIGRWFD